MERSLHLFSGQPYAHLFLWLMSTAFRLTSDHNHKISVYRPWVVICHALDMVVLVNLLSADIYTGLRRFACCLLFRRPVDLRIFRHQSWQIRTSLWTELRHAADRSFRETPTCSRNRKRIARWSPDVGSRWAESLPDGPQRLLIVTLSGKIMVWY